MNRNPRRRFAAAGFLVVIALICSLLLTLRNEPTQAADDAPDDETSQTTETTTTTTTTTTTKSEDPASDGPCAQSEDKTKFYRPHYFVEDAVAKPAEKFGPEIQGANAQQVIEEIQRRTCADPALLVDLENHRKYGPTIKVDGAERYAQIRTLNRGSNQDWDKRVERLIDAIKAGNPHLMNSKSAYYSWAHVARGNGMPGLTAVHSGGKASTYLVYETKGGPNLIRANCGAQPSALK